MLNLYIGEEFIDTVTVGDLTITQQSIGAASFAEGFGSGVDGILGYAQFNYVNF